MADKIFVGLDASTIETAPKFDAYTKVTVTNGENSWSKGTSGGRELVVEIPIATTSNGATMAQNILNKVNGFRYQPYSAVDAVISPAAEIGDAITIGGVYGGIYSQDIVFDSGAVSNVSAPNDEEIDSEYPFLSNSERDRIRQKRQTAANTTAIESNTTAIENNTDDITYNTTVINENTRDISDVTARVDTIEAKYVTTSQLSVTNNNVSVLQTYFTGTYAANLYATAINCTRINLGSYTATWQSKTISGTTIYYLGRT